MSDKTCDNCDMKDLCKFKDMMGGICNLWQPIPVATTEPRRNATEEQKYQEHLFDELHDAIAKRDDLIRRMAEMLGYQGISWGRKVEFERLISEANELMGVK